MIRGAYALLILFRGKKGLGICFYYCRNLKKYFLTIKNILKRLFRVLCITFFNTTSFVSMLDFH